MPNRIRRPALRKMVAERRAERMRQINQQTGKLHEPAMMGHIQAVERVILEQMRPTKGRVDWEQLNPSIHYLEQIQRQLNIATPAYVKGLRSELRAGNIPREEFEEESRIALLSHQHLVDILTKIKRMRQSAEN